MNIKQTPTILESEDQNIIEAIFKTYPWIKGSEMLGVFLDEETGVIK